MSSMDDRKQAFENKFAHDAEMKFKAEARRDKKLAVWASELLGVDAAEYTRVLIKADMELEGAEDVIGKMIEDLAGKAGEATIRAKVAEYDIEAKEEIMNEV